MVISTLVATDSWSIRVGCEVVWGGYNGFRWLVWGLVNSQALGCCGGRGI